MHRIDGPNYAPGNLFTDGDPTAGTPATVVTDTWLNAVQEELANVIVTGAGLALAKADNTQLLAAIRKLAGAFVPVGAVMWGYFPAAPSGFLLLNGALVSRTTYSALWSWVNTQGLAVSESAWSGGASGSFSVGNGSSNFRLPDLRGEFVRGWDNGRGLDSGRTLGSTQADALRAHGHDMQFRAASEASGGFSDSSGFVVPSADTDLGTLTNTSAIQSTGATETRPRNVALTAVIRY